MLPVAETFVADKGYDSDAFREALAERGITLWIPPRAKRRLPDTYCETLYRQRHKVENMFAKLAAYLNALRPLRPHILQRYLHRGNRYLLARSMSPDPRFLAGVETPNIALQFGPQLVAVGCTRCDREQTPQLVSKPNAGFKDDLRRTTEIECFRYGEQPRSSTANRRAGLIRIAFQIEEASLAKY